MLEYCHQDLEQIKDLLQQLNSETYRQEISLLSGVSIGQHVRHIIEFYQCLTSNPSILSYDNRERASALENSLVIAIERIEKIQQELNRLKLGQNISLLTNLDPQKDNVQSVHTSVERELMYCLEHSIHHQAIIKIAVKVLDVDVNLNPNFGVAPATIRHQMKNY